MSDIRLGRYQDVLADVECDAVICDPPYSKRTQDGHDVAARGARCDRRWVRSDGRSDPARARQQLSYVAWNAQDIGEFVEFWVPRCRGWFVCLSDSQLIPAWRDAFELHGLTSFQPLPCVIPGMTVRLAGDGPSSWAIYANVARPKALSRWGTLRGAYDGPPGEREHIGGKPLWLMRALIRDYTKPGDLVCDPTAGGGTTLIAAGEENRRAVGAEVDLQTHAKARERMGRGYTPSFDFSAGVR